MSKAKVIKTLLKTLTSRNISTELYTSLVSSHMRGLKTLKPKDPERYVGIELECYSELTYPKFFGILMELDIDKYVEIADDGSIEPDFGRSYEIRVLVPEKKVAGVLKKLGVALRRGGFDTNDSCGLHVHLDMRNRNWLKCYNKLLKFQDIMFGMVDTDRWYSDYCAYTTQNNASQRYVAVNRLAYAKHKTIEVRLHEGTTDMDRVHNWIKLLLKAINGPTVKEITSKKDVLSWAGKNKKIKTYLNNSFNVEWLQARDNVVKGASTEGDREDNY